MSTDEEQLAWLREQTQLRGFDPDVEEFEIFEFFTLEEAKNSLFSSTTWNPIPVYVKYESDSNDRIAVVIDTARSVYGADPMEYPDWYFEGWVLPSGFVPGMRFKRVRMFVFTLGENEFVDGDYLHWQWIKEPQVTALPIDASLQKLRPHSRTSTLLRSRGIETIGQLLEFAKRHDFSEIPGFGPGLLANLVERLAEAGYGTGDFSFRGQ